MPDEAPNLSLGEQCARGAHLYPEVELLSTEALMEFYAHVGDILLDRYVCEEEQARLLYPNVVDSDGDDVRREEEVFKDAEQH